MRYLVALALLISSLPAPAQEVQRYVGPNRKPQPVDDAHRLPVAVGPNGSEEAALDSTQSHQQSSGVTVTGSNVFYGVTITLGAGEGPGRVLVWDRATVPADGALPIGDRPMRCLYVDAGDRTITFGSTNGLGMTNGLAWAFSTAASCQTLARATANFVAVSYKRVQP